MNIKTFVQVISSLPANIAVLAKGPTGIGNGVAIPHVKINGINKLSGFFLILEKARRSNHSDSAHFFP